MSKSFSLPKSDNVLYLAASIADITASLVIYSVIQSYRETGIHWQRGEEDDEFRRLHACIRPFSELPEDEQNKNRKLIGIALGLQSSKEEKTQ